MLKKITKTGLLSVFLFIVLVGIGVFLFILDYERRQIKLSENNIQIVLSEDEWTKKDFELTIKYSGNASRHIKEYSFDNGKTWTKSNMIAVKDNNVLNIKVKDINNKIYSLDYEIKNIDREGPKIEVPKNIQITRGSKVNISDYVEVKDEKSGLRDEVVYTPNVLDTSKNGVQTIQIYAIDKLANKTISKIDFNIVDKAQEIAVDKISLDHNRLNLLVNEEDKLTPSITPKYATNKSIKWTSSNDKIVTVDIGGKIKAISEGEAIITATTANGKKASCEIIVTK